MIDYSKGPPLGQIAKELGGYVTFAEILKALRQTEDPRKATPEVVASLITPHSLIVKKVALPTPIPRKLQQNSEIAQISKELNVTIKGAGNFIVQIRNLLGYGVKYSVILKAIKQIEDGNQVSPEAVASLIPAITFHPSPTLTLIAKKLNVDTKTAVSFITQVRNLLGYSVKYKVILEVIKQIANREQVTPETVAPLLQKVRPFHGDLFSLALKLKEQIKKEAYQTFFTSLDVYLPPEAINTLKDFSRQCWREINNEKRRYQVPSKGRAEIMVSDRLKNLIDLNLVRFIQEGIAPPGVFLEFEFSEPSIVDTVIVKNDGSIEGFHESVGVDDSFRIIIEAVALAYYRDLVTPGKVSYYERDSGGPRTKRSLNSLSPKPRELPRPQHVPLHIKNTPRLKGRQSYHLYAWHEAQERARHGVVGHIRWIGRSFIASPRKQRQAWEVASIKLRPGYTWVIEHERGEPGSSGLRLSPDGCLMEITLFLPPERASVELDKLLL